MPSQSPRHLDQSNPLSRSHRSGPLSTLGRLAAVVVAVELGEAEAVIEGAGRGIARLDLQANAGCSAVLRPESEAGDDPAGAALAPPVGIGDHRLVAQEP